MGRTALLRLRLKAQTWSGVYEYEYLLDEGKSPQEFLDAQPWGVHWELVAVDGFELAAVQPSDPSAERDKLAPQRAKLKSKVKVVSRHFDPFGPEFVVEKDEGDTPPVTEEDHWTNKHSSGKPAWFGREGW